MANQDRTTPDPIELARDLAERPWSFDFFQALRLLECAHRRQPRLGRSLRPADDSVRLAQEPSLIFAPSTLAAFEPRSGGPPRLEVRFFGLLGPNGPLPLHLTEYARERLRNVHDPTFVRFLDVFHHRMLSLFYRGWADAQPTVSLDRPEDDRFSGYLGALFGMGMGELRERDAAPDFAKLHYAGRLVCQTRHPEGLRAMIADFFQIPADIQEFVGHWMTIPPALRCRLGESPETGALGLSVTIGERVWDRQHKFRVVLGPMGYADFQRLLPGGDSLGRLVAWVRNYCDDELAWDLRLILRKEEVPPLRLGTDGRLGWTTWLTSRVPERDADDLLLNARAYADGLNRKLDHGIE